MTDSINTPLSPVNQLVRLSGNDFLPHNLKEYDEAIEIWMAEQTKLFPTLKVVFEITAMDGSSVKSSADIKFPCVISLGDLAGDETELNPDPNGLTEVELTIWTLLHWIEIGDEFDIEAEPMFCHSGH